MASFSISISKAPRPAATKAAMYNWTTPALPLQDWDKTIPYYIGREAGITAVEVVALALLDDSISKKEESGENE
eukprot:14436052-Ditylum_brightwellii.AAC.1